MKYLLLAFTLSWCGPVTDQHYDVATYYGGAVEAAQAVLCVPVLGVLRCDVYHPYGEPIEMWCDDLACEYMLP